MDNIDLKLVMVITGLHKTRSVSQTAANLDLTRSAVSMNLAKLREHFRDPLFVRTSRGMEPTQKAAALIDILENAESLLHLALGYRLEFDPAVSDRLFRIALGDAAQVRLLPPLMKRLRDLAPSVRLETQSISEDTGKMLECGEVDLAVGFIPPIRAGYCQQTLFNDRFVCAVSANHPRVQNELTLEQLREEAHLVVSASGTGHLFLERTLMARGVTRKVGLSLTSFFGVDEIIADTEYLCLLPEEIGQIMATSGKIRRLSLPFQAPAYGVTQNWHERYSQDPANIWLRRLVAETFMRRREPAERLAAVELVSRANRPVRKSLSSPLLSAPDALQGRIARVPSFGDAKA